MSRFFKAYQDIRSTCSNLPAFDFFRSNFPKAIERIKKQVLNSKTAEEINYEKGANILIGGNATGRGMTFPRLQVVYYCRQSKSPQADTLWQHSRIFGYDRISESCRIFLPPKLLQIFRHLNEANDALFNVLCEKGPDQVVLTPLGVKPTRKNVLDQEAVIPIVGDANYYLDSATHKNTVSLDRELGNANKEEEISIEEALNILNLVHAEEDSDRLNLNLYMNCLAKLKSAGEKACFLIVRVDRDITKGTGSLLSPNDRLKGAAIIDKTVLTLYRVNGQREKGWGGHPVWIPNIKFPKGRCFYTVSS